MNNSEDTRDVWFHIFDDSSPVLFPFRDAAAITFELGTERVRDAGDVL